MRAIEVAESIQWVGAVDWNLRDFHGYETPRGTTYNAYLVRGAHTTALVDTVKKAFVPELLSRVTSVCDPGEIAVIVVNHVEPDHNSGLRDVLAACPNARVVASGSGVKGVAEYHDGLAVEAVGAKDSLDLGGLTLEFQPMPMVHWPDSMFTYCPQRRTLMPNDAFGQHMASSGRFADEVGYDLAIEELTVYYANILMPLGAQVAKAVGKVAERGWDCATIAPSHGVIWRGDGVSKVVEAYGRLTSGETRDKVVVAYATMWGSTDTMARAVADGVAAEGAECALYDLAVTPIATVTRHLLDAKALLLGSATLHHGMLFRAAGYLQWLAGLKPAGKTAGAFGSFGWGGGACEQMEERLAQIGFTLAQEKLTVKFAPTEEDVARCVEWGSEAVRAMRTAAEASPEPEPTPAPEGEPS